MSDGKVSVPFGRFLGYDRGENGELVVNREQALIVKQIYSMFLKGMTYTAIVRTLTEEGIPTPGGKEKWGSRVVKSILTNEKYMGDALLQKSYTVDFLTKKEKSQRRTDAAVLCGRHSRSHHCTGNFPNGTARNSETG